MTWRGGSAAVSGGAGTINLTGSGKKNNLKL